MRTLSITELVKDKNAIFVYFRDGEMIYDVVDNYDNKIARFPIKVSDKEEVGNASFEANHKAITLMRYIRKAIKEETIFIY